MIKQETFKQTDKEDIKKPKNEDKLRKILKDKIFWSKFQRGQAFKINFENPHQDKQL